jgi:hypothetical protein
MSGETDYVKYVVHFLQQFRSEERPHLIGVTMDTKLIQKTPHNQPYGLCREVLTMAGLTREEDSRPFPCRFQILPGRKVGRHGAGIFSRQILTKSRLFPFSFQI